MKPPKDLKSKFEAKMEEKKQKEEEDKENKRKQEELQKVVVNYIIDVYCF